MKGSSTKSAAPSNCENCSKEDCTLLGGDGRSIFSESRSSRSPKAGPKMSCGERAKKEGILWYRVSSHKNATLGRREDFRKARYPSEEDFEQFMEDKYLFSRLPPTIAMIERLDEILRDRDRRMDCEDCGRYNNIDSCSSCRLFHDETSYILGKQEVLVEAVRKKKVEEVTQEMDEWCAKRVATIHGLAYKMGRAEASRRDDYKRADYDPKEGYRYLAWRKAAFPNDEVCPVDEEATPSDDRPRTPHKPEGVRASSARAVRWRLPPAGEETRDIGTRDKVETRRQAASARSDREARASPLRPRDPMFAHPTSDEESEDEVTILDDPPKSSPEERDSPRPLPKKGRRTRSQVVVSGMEDQQPRAGPSKASEQRGAPRKPLPVLGVGPAEAIPRRSQEVRAGSPPPGSSWPCDHCSGTEDEPACRMYSTLGNKESNFCNRRLFKCPIRGTLTLVHWFT